MEGFHNKSVHFISTIKLENVYSLNKQKLVNTTRRDLNKVRKVLTTVNFFTVISHYYRVHIYIPIHIFGNEIIFLNFLDVRGENDM